MVEIEKFHFVSSVFIEAHIEVHVQEVQKNESKLCDKIGIPSAIINPNYLMKEA